MVLFDLPVYQFFISFFTISPFMVNVMKFFTSFGSTIFIVCGILSVAILFKDKKYFLNFDIANGIGVVLNNVIKLIVRRPRPSVTMPFSYEKSFSFPSGHTMMSTIFYGLIIYYVYKNIKNEKLKYFLVSILSLIDDMIGISIIYLCVNYATEYLADYILGIVYLVAYIKISNKLWNKKHN